jgi:hypothetical protein
MAKITPLAAVPGTAPAGVAAASILNVPPSELLWVSGRVTAGTVGLRPYFFEVEATSSTGIGGAWVPLGGDAVAGSGPVSFDVSEFAGCASGSYTNRRLARDFVLVKEDDVGSVFDFVHLSAELSTVGQ